MTSLASNVSATPAPAIDDNGHTLVSLWKVFYKAQQADLPQDQVKALEAIKTEAAAKRLAWDWYDAANTYVNVRSSINWKDREKVLNDMNEEIVQFDEPIVTFYHKYNGWSAEETNKFITQNEARLKNSFNPEFHIRDSRVNSRSYSSVLKAVIKNDYEYALWSTFLGRRGSDKIEDYYEDRYPEEALIEYTQDTRYWDKSAYDKMGVFAEEYAGKAVSLLARQHRLEWEFRELNSSKTSKSSDYKALRSNCETFERNRKKFNTGIEKVIADCCTNVSDLIKTLDGKYIDIEVKDDELSLILRNVSSLSVVVAKDGKSAWETKLTNSKSSYYVLDTLKVNIPDLDDGDYTIAAKSGSCEGRSDWRKHSLSISMRLDSKGWGVFVADYKSGEPLKSCELQLLDADGKLMSSVSGFRPNGFAPIPEKLACFLTGSYDHRKLQAQYKDKNGRLRNSCELGFNDHKPTVYSDDADVSRAVILTDRSAFNPGETVHFKAICYKGTYDYTLAPEGQTIKLSLIDPEGNKVATRELVTNDFGSADGSIQLPMLTGGKGSSRGGLYALKIQRTNGTTLAYKNIRVDEFVLPTFDITWDTDNTLYMPGDIIKVSGKVQAYSGHSLTGARASYAIGYSGDIKKSEDLKLNQDGSFAFDFQVDKRDWHRSYPISVKITDGTGETLEFSTHRTVYDYIPLNLGLQNGIAGTYTLKNASSKRSSGEKGFVRDDTADIRFSVSDLQRESLRISYTVTADADGKQVASGTANPGETIKIPVAKLPSGLYRVDAEATAIAANGSKVSTKRSTTFIKASDKDTALNMDVACFFKELDSEDIALQIGTTDGPAWVVVELFGSGNILLDSQIVKLDGVRGKAGSLKTVSYSRRASWPESLKLCAFFFHKGEVYRYTRTIELPVATLELPLEYTRFIDRVRPGEQVSLLIRTNPGVECAATVFDKASETIMSNRWAPVKPVRRPEPSVYYSSSCGVNQTGGPYYALYAARGSSVANKGMVLEEAVAERAVADSDDAVFYKIEETPPAKVRENFAATMAWEPFLRSDSQGNIELKLTGCDRLSKYYVQLFAHGAGMHNATLRREMQVTIPVKLSLVEPKYLYENDIYVASASVASTLGQSVSGSVAIRFYDGADYRNSQVIGVKTERVTLPAGGSLSVGARFPVPEGVKQLGVLLNFVPDDLTIGSDAMFVSIPVYKPFQTLTEAHSALLRNPADRERLIAELRSLFVNMDASQLVPQERSILDMVREAIPDKVEPRCNDAMSLTEAWYANTLAQRLGAPGLDAEAVRDIKSKIAACQNSGGGIAWFEGMKASAVITAAVLQRVAALQDSDAPIDVNAAVKYLDDSYFGNSGKPLWWGVLSLEQYLHTRAMFADVPFDAPVSGKALRQFKKDVKAYLTPTGKRGLNAQILAKARRLHTLRLLAGSADGQQLAKAWGISFRKCLLKSMDADLKSLLQYAVEHKSGGYYYPNAVMPWRGLLESELYAHTLLCNLLGDNTVAEGIRLWLMIQKETQQWDTDAAYIEAIAAVLRGTPETLNTKVVALSGSYTKPFEEVKAAGNGFTVSCKWYSGDKELAEGDHLTVGDKVTARYEVWNEENRSFVRICAPRPASLRPVAQLSCPYGWWLAPIGYRGWNISPQGYRNVLADKTEYWFDSYPEEKTTVTEQFYVTQEGSFQTPAIEIESLYAPHYRANGAGRGHVTSETLK